MAKLSSDTVHASCVAIGGHGLLLWGRSGAGKSDLALRLIDRGAALVSDDYTILRRREGVLLASPPTNIAGRIEARGIGILPMPYVTDIPVALILDLDSPVERMPEAARQTIAGVDLPVAALAALEPSAAIKAELLLKAALPPPAKAKR